jgi:hypothetical protein
MILMCANQDMSRPVKQKRHDVFPVPRMFEMRTSKITDCPDRVEQECLIAKDDPYVRESGFVAPRVLGKAI